MKAFKLKSLFIYLLLAVVSIGSSNSFALSPATSHLAEQEVVQQDDHNLPLFSEEIEGTVLLQVVSGKPPGNQAYLTTLTTPFQFRTKVLEPGEPSVYLNLQKDLLKQQIFPFHFFW